ncbi:hypothetical protein ANCCAN_22082 [Ancylostoma caninum]|uniref:Uncharacterized protein n=1 Tax=Ancylostoma caninum TaxID=29170 RepID=A0A368FMR1_ANCCA|nr:hypothetical protein ANCCAN_22082 [Ancylostoma caninum]
MLLNYHQRWSCPNHDREIMANSETITAQENCSHIIKKSWKVVEEEGYAPWTCIVLSCVATAVLTLKIPFTAMENNISDFTPYDARSRQELKIYREFFSNRGEPKTIYAFVSAKDGLNLLKTAHLNETVQST